MKKKSGRPKLPNGRAKSAVVRARISKEEFNKIEKAASKEGCKVSDWIRKTLLLAADSIPVAQKLEATGLEPVIPECNLAEFTT